MAEVPHPALIGDVTDDDVLRKAGIMRATAVVAAINTDAGNVWVTLSARRCGLTLSSPPAPALRRQSPSCGEPARPGSWTRSGSAASGSRQQPNVVEFLDVVMHDGSLEFRLEEVAVRAGSRLAGRTLREAKVSETSGALVLALRGRPWSGMCAQGAAAAGTAAMCPLALLRTDAPCSSSRSAMSSWA